MPSPKGSKTRVHGGGGGCIYIYIYIYVVGGGLKDTPLFVFIYMFILGGSLSNTRHPHTAWSKPCHTPLEPSATRPVQRPGPQGPVVFLKCPRKAPKDLGLHTLCWFPFTSFPAGLCEPNLGRFALEPAKLGLNRHGVWSKTTKRPQPSATASDYEKGGRVGRCGDSWTQHFQELSEALT